MIRWLTYFKERFPLPVYALLVMGIALSGKELAGPFPMGWGLPLALSIGGLLLFFAELRLMDEYKDYDKDRVAHPERPLPRGLLSVDEARRGIVLLMIAMAIFAAVLPLFVPREAGVLYALIAFYLWLMFKEFYVGPRLADWPLVYAITHQIILIPIVAFAVAVFIGRFAFSGHILLVGLNGVGGFFAYEVCRKLDSGAHPVLKTYLQYYGKAGTFLIVLVALAVAAVTAGILHFGRFLWPVEGAVLLAYAAFWAKPSLHKWVEAVASISLLVHLWAAFIAGQLTLRGML